MTENNIYCDYEYNSSNDKHMGLVSGCGCTDKGEIFEGWLVEGERDEAFVEKLKSLKGKTMVCFSASAEARSMIALGLNPLDYKWVDLMLDYKQLQNKDNKYLYGRYLEPNPWLKYTEIFESKGQQTGDLTKYVSPKDFEAEVFKHKKYLERKGLTSKAVTVNLLNATLNFTNISDEQILADANQKNTVRKLIIDRENREFTQEEKETIMEYGRSDISDLHEIYVNMGEALASASKMSPKEVLSARLWRGKVGAMMAMVEANGTPIRLGALQKLTENAPKIELAAKVSCNMNTGLPMCVWKGTGLRDKKWKLTTMSRNYKAMADYIDSNPILAQKWTKTKEKKDKQLDGTIKITPAKYALDKKTIDTFKNDPVVSEYRKLSKVISALSNSKPGVSGKGAVEEAMGADNRLRCPLFPYGTQTGRNTAKASQYIYAQGAWMKAALIDIPKGKRLYEIDYSSCEMFIGGVLSKDEHAIEAYETDIYISFGFVANQFDPKYKSAEEIIHTLEHGSEEDKKQISKTRQGLKAVVLGLSYGAGVDTISLNTGLPIKEVETLVNKYKRRYKKYYAWRDKVWAVHSRQGGKPIALKYSGWYLGKDNTKPLSTQNFPVQGTGSTILHRSLELSLMAGVEVINTLHDSQYILVDEGDTETPKRVCEYMLQASEEILGRTGMKIEMESWGHGERVLVRKGEDDYERYRKYIGD